MLNTPVFTIFFRDNKIKISLIYTCYVSAVNMNRNERKFGHKDDISLDLRNFAEELHHSRMQAEMASKLIGDLIEYHQYFCGETAKSFARLHKKLQEIYPAGCEDLVSLIINFSLVCRSS